LVHEFVMGGCVHPSWRVVSKRSFFPELVCRSCGEEFLVPEDEYGAFIIDAEQPPKDFVQHFVPPYSRDSLQGRMVVGMLERLGWTSKINCKDGIYTCTFIGKDGSFEGPASHTEQKAICEAAAVLARKGLVSNK
jgi:hypothetical protein